MHHGLMLSKLTTSKSGVGNVSERTLRLVFQGIVIFYCLMQIAECALGWAESNCFGQFLNNWAIYEHRFRNCFPDFENTKGIQELALLRRKLLLWYVALPFCTLTAMLAFGFQSGFGIAIFYIIHMSVCFVEDVKVIMSCEAIAGSYKILKEAIREEVGIQSKLNRSFSPGYVRKWRGLVLFLRQQVAAAGDYQKSHQLSVMACSVLIITGILFILLNGTFQSAYASASQALVGFVGLVGVIRVYGKILAAERITTEVGSANKLLLW